MALEYARYDDISDLEYRNLVELYHHSIDRYAEHRLFGVKREGVYEWTSYADFGDRVERCRAGLASLGVGPGDTVAIISDNRPEWAICAYGTYTLGARFCPMYESQSDKDWKYIINDSDAKVVLVANQEIGAKLRTMRQAGGFEVSRILHFDGPDDHSLRELMDRTQPGVAAVEPDKDDICGLIYTSGTTGEPKGVLLSHHNIASNVEAIHSFGLLRDDDISLSFLPWAHSFGQTAEMHGMFAAGASVALVEDISTISTNLQEIRPTLLFSVPRIFNKIYEGVRAKVEEEGGIKKKLFEKALDNSNRLRRERQSDGHASTTAKLLDKFYDRIVFSKVRDRFGGRLRYAISGGAKLNAEVAHFIDNMHIDVLEGYGLTETSPLVAVNIPGQRKIGSVGRPVRDVEVRIVPVASSERYESEEYPRGEVCVRGPNVMKGYYKKPDQTAEAIDDEGWFHTGDLGYLDDDGFLWIEGRAKEEYKLANGKYVAPGPLEEQLKLGPHIDDVMIEGHDRPFNIAIVNVDHESLVRWAKEHDIDTDNLLESRRVRELIEDEVEARSSEFKTYERPRELVIIDDEWTPENGVLTPTLKLKRRVIYERYRDQIEEAYSAVSE